MSQSIGELTLFIASSSRSSMGCLNYISNHQIPINVVRLDSKEARDIAANGKFFQINVVPTLVVVYTDNNTQLFIGADKIIKWFHIKMKNVRSRPSNVKSHNATKTRNSKNYMGDTSLHTIMPKNTGREVFVNDDLEDHVEDVEPENTMIIEEDDENLDFELEDVVVEEDELEDIPKMKKPKKSKRKPKKPKKEEAIEIIQHDEEITTSIPQASEKMDSLRAEADRKMREFNSSRTKGANQKSSIGNLASIAKQMEESRQNSLGYNEKDLPRF